MSKIVILDENMINLIAAGEVVERPASVVKELLENAIDAGARKITVAVEDGGKKLISVCDDGCGMDMADMEKAFLPHATSKVRSSGDLAHIATMGFRGEALASIASVSRLTALSRTADSNEAAKIEIDCGKRILLAPASGAPGTSIEVQDIFYRVPARQKFLRSANTEMTHIAEQFSRIALARCDLDLTLIHNGREIYKLVSNQSVRERIAVLISRQIASDLLELDSREREMDVHGLIGLPAAARATSEYQYIFLNGRFIRDKFISHALKEAYRGLIEPGRSPVIFIFLRMPPERFDVNVHPTKIEVRFDNSNLVHSQVLAVLRQKLLGTNLDVPATLPPVEAPQIQSEQLSDIKNERRQQIADAMANFFKEHRPTQQKQFNYQGTESGHRVQGSGYSVQENQGTGDDGRDANRNATAAASNTQPATGDVEPSQTVPKAYLQLHDSYIVAQVNEGFVIIDQHALHERIIYEELCRRVSQGPLESQRLLIPENFEVTPAQAQALEHNTELIEKLGIKIEPFGPRTMAVQSFPTLLTKLAPQNFIQELLDLLTDKRGKLDAERLLHEILDMAACKAAIKAGQKLSEGEIEALLADKDAVERASRCPHGRPTTLTFSLADLEKQFKRT